MASASALSFPIMPACDLTLLKCLDLSMLSIRRLRYEGPPPRARPDPAPVEAYKRQREQTHAPSNEGPRCPTVSKSFGQT
eukprot:1149543-Pelagomonas_calceolata.AAC.1